MPLKWVKSRPVCCDRSTNQGLDDESPFGSDPVVSTPLLQAVVVRNIATITTQGGAEAPSDALEVSESAYASRGRTSAEVMRDGNLTSDGDDPLSDSAALQTYKKGSRSTGPAPSSCSSLNFVTFVFLEIERDVEPREACVLNRRRPPQTGAVVAIVLVVAGLSVGVDDVVEIDPDVGTLAAEAQDLREAHVERVQPLLIDLAVEQQVHRLRRRAGRGRRRTARQQRAAD